MSGQGYYGAAYDRQVPLNNDQSTIYKMKETYWTTKQAVMRKLGKKEDEHIVASDSELDAKLEVFKAIQKSSMDLLRVIERYQDRICVLSREENAMGRLLKAESQHDKTRAGKMMAAVGKAQSFSSQQMLQLRAPLVRLYQEVETFRYRAISDTLVTVNRMEASRTEYRGALLWMKDVSEELDPDTSKQLQKFRTVQAQVKKTKAKFDKLKLDTMQKIDLLAASRCNMFSHVLAKYQSTLLHFWERTAYRMTAVAESFKGYQYYEFNMLKELGEPSKKLAEETGSREAPEHDNDDSDEYGEPPPTKRRDDSALAKPTEPAAEEHPNSDDGNILEFSESDSESLHEAHDEARDDSNVNACGNVPVKARDNAPVASIKDLLDLTCDPVSDPSLFDLSFPTGIMPSLPPIPKAAGALTSSPDEKGAPDLTPCWHLPKRPNSREDKKDETGDSMKKVSGSLNNLLDAIDKEFTKPEDANAATRKPTDTSAPFIDFGEEEDEEEDLEEIKRKQDEEFDFSGMLRQTASESQKKPTAKGGVDLLTDDFDVDDTEKDDLKLLNEILNAPTSGGDDFSREWQAVFGSTPLSASTNLTPVESDNARAAEFMPSCLLDMTSGMSSTGGANLADQLVHLDTTNYNAREQSRSSESVHEFRDMMGGGSGQHQGFMGGQLLTPSGQQTALPPQPAQQTKPTPSSQTGPKPKRNQKQEMSAWFNLFAELDPLANPDAIGRSKEDLTDA